MRYFKFLIFIFCLFFAACSNTPEPNKQIVSQFSGLLPQIVQNDEGLFHGISLGMTMDEVKKNVAPGDSMGSTAEQKDYLEFEGKLTAQKLYDYDCNFDEKGLKDITLDIHLKDEKNADSLYTDFKNYFSKRYGAPTETDGTTMWTTTEGKRPAKIILQEDEEFLYGKLTITFFDKNFDPPAVNADSVLLP
jgi:hypothetical protein